MSPAVCAASSSSSTLVSSVCTVCTRVMLAGEVQDGGSLTHVPSSVHCLCVLSASLLWHHGLFVLSMHDCSSSSPCTSSSTWSSCSRLPNACACHRKVALFWLLTFIQLSHIHGCDLVPCRICALLALLCACVAMCP